MVERRHGGSIIEQDMVTLNIDHMHMGVGGDNTWGAQVHPEFTVTPERMVYGFTIVPVSFGKQSILKKYMPIWHIWRNKFYQLFLREGTL